MKILTATQVKTAEQDAVLNGIFSFADLMKNASEKVALYIADKFDISKSICFVCGNGNNGGDGLVSANILKNKGYSVSLVFPFGKPKSFPATEFLSLAQNIEIKADIPPCCDCLVDALFGIGLNRPLDENAVNVINNMNRCKAQKIAIDIPSGVFADGKKVDTAFFADTTLTFIALKPCFVLPLTSEYCGDVVVIDIGVPTKEFAYLTTEKPLTVKRKKNSHKGTFGTALTVTGSYGMCGASILCAKAALWSGVGIVKSFVCDKNYSAFTSSIPEAVTIPVNTLQNGCPNIYNHQILSALASSDALALGCGLGQSDEAVKLIKNILSLTNIPTVLDADGINALASNIEYLGTVKAPLIITPHPKEMARLLNSTVTDIENNRPEIAKRVATKYKCIVVLKGANTVVAAPDGKVYFNMTGNAGMATGGTGDVLTGMIVSRLAVGESPVDAAVHSVWLHGYLADLALKKYSMEAMTPSDILAELKTVKL